ncbi:hypothetical protein ACH5RR_002228 [Cinchona calisaya]|uniref:DDE Tnp4 domain-containing protein n=1 Tax=Cinchona calisaya TaxID=153742 RepID=A0ABD3B5M7_9GENT
MPEKTKKNSRALAALLSSLISQLLLLLLLFFPSSNPFSSSHQFLFPLLQHFLSTSEISATFSLLSSFPRKRKRTRLLDPDDPTRDDDGSGSGPDSVIPRNPDSFKQFFKMNCSTFEWLCGLLEPLLECRDPVRSPLNLPAETRLGIGLFRLATGSDYPEISRRFRVTELVSKFCVKQLCRVLCTNYRFWVGFPSQNELDSVSTQFEKLAGLPNCCGIIDCTRFKIITNKGSDSISKDSHQEDTIAAQIVVDASSRILSIAAGFRGNKSNLMVLKSSTLYKDIDTGVLLNSRKMYINNVDLPQYLIGGRGYPLLSWLLIPFIDPLGGSREENFNNVVKIMRFPVLKTLASLKGWGVLSRPIDVEFKAAVANIGACSILHNMLLTREDYSAFSDDVSDDSSVYDHSSEYETLDENLNDKGPAIRSALATAAKRV